MSQTCRLNKQNLAQEIETVNSALNNMVQAALEQTESRSRD